MKKFWTICALMAVAVVGFTFTACDDEEEESDEDDEDYDSDDDAPDADDYGAGEDCEDDSLCDGDCDKCTFRP